MSASRPRRTRLLFALLTTALAGTLTLHPTAPPAQAAARATFTHPGVTVSKPQLDFARSKVLSGAQPWKTAYDRMAASKYADLNRTPTPRAIVECGSYSNPNLGCTDEREDAIAAYTQALMWYVTRDARHAAKAIQLMDAWSAVIRDHTNSNAPLQTGWAAPPGPRPPRSSSTPGPAAGPTRTASPPRCATSTCPRSSTARTPTGTGS